MHSQVRSHDLNEDIQRHACFAGCLSNALAKPVSGMFISISQLYRHSYSKVFEFVIELLRHILGVCALAFRRGVVIIEIAGVSCVLDFWDNRALHLAMIQSVPVNGLEERVRLNKSCSVKTAAGNVAEPLRWIDSAKTANEVAGIG